MQGAELGLETSCMVLHHPRPLLLGGRRYAAKLIGRKRAPQSIESVRVLQSSLRVLQGISGKECDGGIQSLAGKAFCLKISADPHIGGKSRLGFLVRLNGSRPS